jgi:asparagine synthase (glutamine-hydrolysing)
MTLLIGTFSHLPLFSHLQYVENKASLMLCKENSVTLQNDHVFIIAGTKKGALHKSEVITPLHEAQGLFVGRLFDKILGKPAVFNPYTTQALLDNTALLTENYWGRYTGALYKKSNNTLTLVRDPLGLSTLFYCTTPTGVIFSNELACLYDFLEVKPLLNVDYFAHYIINNNHALSLTPFQTIKELQPGMALTIDANNTLNEKLIWNIQALQSSYLKDTDTFEEELLSMLQLCTKAWIESSTSGICLELSGGLDSSSLLLLARKVLPHDKKIIAVNYVDSKVISSNETEYAQEISNACNIPLYLIDRQDSLLIDSMPLDYRPDKPSTILLFNQGNQQLLDLALEHQCTEIINGQGGDHLFLASPLYNALADCYLERGIKNAYFTLKELSTIYRMPWFALITSCFKALYGYYRGQHTNSCDDLSLFDTSYKAHLLKQDFYLASVLNNFYPGKAEHIKELYHASAYADRNQRGSSTMSHPLLSQPLVELALKVPTYQTFDQGYDRIFFRKAMSRIQPHKTLWRRMKGKTTSSTFYAFNRQYKEIYEIISQGYFMRTGLINKAWFHDSMIKTLHGEKKHMWSLLHILTSELWLKQWQL